VPLAATPPPPRVFPIDGACTADDIIAIADTIRAEGIPGLAEVRVLTRFGGRHGARVRQLTLLPPPPQPEEGPRGDA